MKNEELFQIVEFKNSKNQTRYKMLWRETGEIAEDYQGWGTKDRDILIRRQSAIIKEVRQKFCREQNELLSGVKNTKEVETRLTCAGIQLPLGMTYLKVYREVAGSNKKAMDTMIANNGGVYEKRYMKKGHLYEYQYCDGELIGFSVDGNDIY